MHRATNATSRVLKQILSARNLLFILIFSGFGLYWIEFTNNNLYVEDDLVNEALENVGNDLRFAEVYRHKSKLQKNLKYILLWTPYDYSPFYSLGLGQRNFIKNNCSMINCFVTTDRDFFDGDVTKFDAIAFNGRNIKSYDLPKQRAAHQKYIYVMLESADQNPVCDAIYDNFFNWTYTYRLDSTIMYPYIIIKDKKGEVVGPKQVMNWVGTSEDDFSYNFEHNKTKAAAWFVSNCNSRNQREKFVTNLQEELERYGLTVDVYGACGTLHCPRDKEHECLDMLEKDYFFYLALENSFDEDYVTEKVLRAFNVNVVPIVYGGANYSRFLPPHSYLDGRRLTPSELAYKMYISMKMQKLYQRYFWWKRYYDYPTVEDAAHYTECSLCSSLNNKRLVNTKSTYKEFRRYWNPDYKNRCPWHSDTSMHLYKHAYFYWPIFLSGFSCYNLFGVFAWWNDTSNKRTQYILVWPDKSVFPFSEMTEGREEFVRLKCPRTNCFFTSNRTFFEDIRTFDAIAFKGNSLSRRNLPKKRAQHQKYIFFNMESSPNYPVQNEIFDGFFNWSASYRLDSDILLPYMLIKDKLGNTVGPQRDMNWVIEEELDPKIVSHSILEHKTQAAAIFLSNCESLSDREEMVKDLNRALKRYSFSVDVYGSCGPYKCDRTNQGKCNEILKRKYYFYLSYENSLDEDYVTEKLLTPLQNSVVPIVYGGANYSRFLPPGSYIDATEVTSRKLAKIIVDLIKSPKKYMQFFWWKKYYTYHNPILKENICNICAVMNDYNLKQQNKTYVKFRKWWNIDGYDDDIFDRMPTCKSII